MNEKHTIAVEHVTLIRDWLKNRGGVAIWDSINLSNPGGSWTAPVNDEHGQPKSKPTWQAGNAPSRVITDATEIQVVTPREVSRFHIALQQGSGFSVVLTDASTRKVRRAVEKAGPDAWYQFEDKEAVIYVPGDVVDLDKVN